MGVVCCFSFCQMARTHAGVDGRQPVHRTRDSHHASSHADFGERCMTSLHFSRLTHPGSQHGLMGSVRWCVACPIQQNRPTESPRLGRGEQLCDAMVGHSCRLAVSCGWRCGWCSAAVDHDPHLATVWATLDGATKGFQLFKREDLTNEETPGLSQEVVAHGWFFLSTR
jgi:hypothetical protein